MPTFHDFFSMGIEIYQWPSLIKCIHAITLYSWQAGAENLFLIYLNPQKNASSHNFVPNFVMFLTEEA